MPNRFKHFTKRLSRSLLGREYTERDYHMQNIEEFKSLTAFKNREDIVTSLLWYFLNQKNKLAHLPEQIEDDYLLNFKQPLFGLKYKGDYYLCVYQLFRLNVLLRTLDLKDYLTISIVSVVDNRYTLRRFIRKDANQADKVSLNEYLFSLVFLLETIIRNKDYSVISRIKHVFIMGLFVGSLVDDLVELK